MNRSLRGIRRTTAERLLLAATCLFASVFGTPVALADAVDKVFQEQHLGVATCATSQCHGKSRAESERNVQLNEYTLWADSDRHSVAYRTLESEESQLMARKLGIEDATKDALCLDCHTDNIPPNLRGNKFLISDGVGCEACHGGSGRWIETHTSKEATHAQNLAEGMIATDRADVRAEICLSCHQGTNDKFATHRIMGAGHPRLSFELELFSANQPAHYTVDDDYVERKGRTAGHRLWLIGQIEQARQSLEVASQRLHQNGALPELAFFDCHSCHHPMSEQRWTRRRADGLEPGSLRLHLPNMVVLQAIAGSFEQPELVSSLRSAHRKALRGAQADRKTFQSSVTALLQVLDTAATSWSGPMNNSDVARMRKALLNSAATDGASDYAEAEQVYFGFESLCYALNEAERCAPGLDKLFETVADSNTYKPGTFARVAKELLGSF